MGARIVLLRGINIGPNNRIPMPGLRSALTEAGYERVRTYVASGNVVLDSTAPEAKLNREIQRLIVERFDLNIPVVSRTAEELAEVIDRNPFPDIDCPPKLYQVSFLDRPADPERLDALQAYAAPGERLAAVGREWYAAFPDGIAKSKLAAKMAARDVGVTATARNWRTVTTLHEMACEATG